MVGVPALITETFSCSYPKHHRARTHKPEVNKHTQHVVVEPDVATPPTGETDGGDVPGGGAGKPDGGAGPAAEQSGTGSTTDPAVKPAATSPKTSITTKTTVTKTTVTASSKPKTAAATAATLPKTADNNWIAASLTLFILGTAILAAAYRC